MKVFTLDDVDYYAMHPKYLLSAIGFIFFACSGLKQLPKIEQGLSGYIYLLKGNQMPSPGRPISKGLGVSRDIYIYEPTTINLTEGISPVFTIVKSRLIAHTKSDTAGHYAISLPVGKYSVFIKEGTAFFAAESDGNGVLNPFEITQKAITQKNITISFNAVY